MFFYSYYLCCFKCFCTIFKPWFPRALCFASGFMDSTNVNYRVLEGGHGFISLLLTKEELLLRDIFSFNIRCKLTNEKNLKMYKFQIILKWESRN